MTMGRDPRDVTGRDVTKGRDPRDVTGRDVTMGRDPRDVTGRDVTMGCDPTERAAARPAQALGDAGRRPARPSDGGAAAHLPFSSLSARGRVPMGGGVCGGVSAAPLGSSILGRLSSCGLRRLGPPGRAGPGAWL